MTNTMFDELHDMSMNTIDGNSTDVTNELLEMERARRIITGAYEYPQPARWHSLIYAIQEMGETFDAAITRQIPGQVRRKDKDISPAVELGDCLSMLCTALLSADDLDELPEEAELEREVYGQAAYHLGVALMSFSENSIHMAIHRVAALAELYGVTPAEAMSMSHAKIYGRIADKEKGEKGE